MTAARLAIGMCGWNAEPWTGGFYPDDLPEDWRLAYYANEFQRVYLPAAYLLGADGQVLEGWAADVPTQFRFVVEVPPGWDHPQLQVRLAPLLPRVAALLPSAGQGVDLAAVDSALPLTPRDALWTPQTGCRSAPCRLGLIHIDAPVSAAVLKGWVADLAAQAGTGETVTLIFTGAAQALDAARQARVIAELMGL